jgi:uncharacterized protein
VLILLPPSEGKTAPPSGPALSLASLAFPDLLDTREHLVAALLRLCEGPRARARATLGISERLDEEVTRNAQLMTSPTAPAASVYTGVLYDALDWSSLTAAQRKRAGARVVIASALFGLVRATDLIPAYRLSADTTLPSLGSLRSLWNPIMSEAIAAAAPRGAIVDMRSAAYVGLGPIPGEVADRSATVRVLQERGGTRKVVSHHNKATKGRLTRALLDTGRITGVADLAGALGAAGYRVEVMPGRTDETPWTIDVIVDEV